MPPRRALIAGEEGKTKGTEERFQGNTALTSLKGKINIEIPQKDERMSPPRKRRQISFQGGQSSHKVIHGATAVWQVLGHSTKLLTEEGKLNERTKRECPTPPEHQVETQSSSIAKDKARKQPAGRAVSNM